MDPVVDPETRDVFSPGELVVVRLGGCRYGLPMNAVAEVGRPPGLTRVPGTPDWLAGLANWRGRVLAVVDLRGLLDATPLPLDRRSRLVILHHEGRATGLIAEAVDGTATPGSEAVEPVLAHLAASGAALLAGQFTDADGPVGVIDLAAVFALADTLPRPRRSAAAAS